MPHACGKKLLQKAHSAIKNNQGGGGGERRTKEGGFKSEGGLEGRAEAFSLKSSGRVDYRTDQRAHEPRGEYHRCFNAAFFINFILITENYTLYFYFYFKQCCIGHKSGEEMNSPSS